ncbi:helix-turn-helix domain-containing protein [Photobacterium phosphoreum]|uniref:helix-turn-helix domain-containing protein n=1 Tax=Photobacterium phosphoreum TaxID=659 RepID=UPI0015E6E773|nr:helix-turn-helix domain-containing protein [Photobacterium phosphoreum]
MNDFYTTTSDKGIETIKNAIGVALSLSIDHELSHFVKRTGLLDQTIEIIDNNYKNNEFSLTKLADKVGVSTKTIQNILSKYDVKFYSYLQAKRCIDLKFSLSTNKNYNLEYLAINSGFKNLSAANREFKKKYQCSINNYIKNI